MDLSHYFLIANARVADALATSGTTVDLRRGRDEHGGTVNTATLAPVAPTTPAVYATGVPALVIGTPGATSTLPATPTTTSAYTVVLGPALDVRERDEVVVTACLDARLVGKVLTVESLLRSSVNAAQRLSAVPV